MAKTRSIVLKGRDYWRPFKAGKKLELPKGLTLKDCEVWVYPTPKGPGAMGFRGPRAAKPCFKYYFKTAANRDDYILDFYLEVYKRKNAQLARKQFTNKLKKGDVLYSSWGYDQTNIDFYIVLESKGKTITAQGLAQHSKTVGWATERVKANKNKKIGKPFKKRISYPGDMILINGRYPARKWDGRELVATSYA